MAIDSMYSWTLRTGGEQKVIKAYVMMGTYNGAAYVERQIASILQQRGVDITLRICDDGSTDGTAELIEGLAAGDSRIVFTANKENKGVWRNFMDMIQEADDCSYDVYAFSDQDDLWHVDKLLTACGALRFVVADKTATSVPGFGIPVLYCSDLINFVDNTEKGKRELEYLTVDFSKRATLLLRNYFSGCTMAFNAAMLRLLQHFVPDSPGRLHDAWAVLVAYYIGNLYVDKYNAFIYRRIHAGNVSGVSEPGADFRKLSISRVVRSPKRYCVDTAHALLCGYSALLDHSDRLLIQSFAGYRGSLRTRLLWCFSNQIQLNSRLDTLTVRIKLLLGRY